MKTNQQTNKQAKQDFFIRGRELTLPSKKPGVFLRYGRTKSVAWVFEGTFKKPASGKFTVMTSALEDANLSAYWSVT